MRSPKRVLVIFNAADLYGMERCVIETFDGLRPEVTPEFMISLGLLRKDLPLRTEITRRGLPYSFFSDHTDWPRVGKPRSWRHAWQIVAALLRGNRDVLKRVVHNDALYVPSLSYFYFCFLAAAFCRFTAKPVLYHFHDFASSPRLAFRLASFLITDYIHNAKLSMDIVVKCNPFVLKRANHCIPNFIDTRRLLSGHVGALSEFEGKRNLVFVGRVSPTKGVDILIEAYKVLFSQYHDLAMHIVGEAASPAFEAEFQRLVDAASANIQLWGYRMDVSDFLSIAYVYVHPTPPSRCHESFGRGAVEAMACGVPVISFASGALQEIVQDGVNGLLCEEETATCLAEKMSRLVGDPGLRDRLSEGARRTYGRRYSNRIVRQAWLELLRAGESSSCAALDRPSQTGCSARSSHAK